MGNALPRKRRIAHQALRMLFAEMGLAGSTVPLHPDDTTQFMGANDNVVWIYPDCSAKDNGDRSAECTIHPGGTVEVYVLDVAPFIRRTQLDELRQRDAEYMDECPGWPAVDSTLDLSDWIEEVEATLDRASDPRHTKPQRRPGGKAKPKVIGNYG